MDRRPGVCAAGLFLFGPSSVSMAGPPLPGITCVLFDLDGVLVDVSGSYRLAIAKTAETFTGLEVTPDLIQQFKNRGGLNDDWELTAAIIQDAGIRVDFQAVVEEFQRRYRGLAWNGLIANEPPLIDSRVFDNLASAGIDLGVVTGRPYEEARWTLDRFMWRSMFKVVIAREQQGDRPKPDAFPLEQALAQLDSGPQPGTAVYVGDAVDDMLAATRAGMIPIGFVPPYLDVATHGDLLRRHGARFVLSSHDELLQILGVEFARE